eukprot:748647-Hanusia_phi.AAC.2
MAGRREIWLGAACAWAAAFVLLVFLSSSSRPRTSTMLLSSPRRPFPRSRPAPFSSLSPLKLAPAVMLDSVAEVNPREPPVSPYTVTWTGEE